MSGSRIIKRWSTGSDAYELVPRPTVHDQFRANALLRDAAERAEIIVAQAEAQAAALRAAAEQERLARRQQVEAEALARAREEARAELATEIDQSAAGFRALVRHAVVTEAAFRREARAEALTLAVAIAERILAREIRQDPAAVEQIAALALTHTQASPVTQIIVHPDDLPVMERWARGTLGPGVDAVDLVGDPAVRRGGCVIGTKSGFVDARVETQLAEVRAALAEAIADVDDD